MNGWPALHPDDEAGETIRVHPVGHGPGEATDLATDARPSPLSAADTPLDGPPTASAGPPCEPYPAPRSAARHPASWPT